MRRSDGYTEKGCAEKAKAGALGLEIGAASSHISAVFPLTLSGILAA
jgi:hypothetical protein